MNSQDSGPYSMLGGHDVKHTFVTLALCDFCGGDNQKFPTSTLFSRKTICLPLYRVYSRTTRPI